ncbi:MAG TPA: (2Fe-2S)-binding protein [Acidobacteriota bacterium]|nr:(2Fe-2S)-binding protein [Acidobacteriota bacterium]
MPEEIRFNLNGRPVTVRVEPERRLLWVLRTELGLTGTKYGCGSGLCGACTVVVDQRAVRSCVTSVGSVSGKTVTTIEGLARNGELHPLQEAFIRHDALQCGICTPGMIMHAYALLQRNPRPNRDQILQGMERNLCRCGAYARIVAAVQDAATGGKE